MSRYLSPKKRSINKSMKRSPIASKERVKSPKKPRRSLVKALLNRFETDSKAIFSPKYVDTTQHFGDENAMNSPPPSPLKRRERLDKECDVAVRSIKQSVWNSAHEDMDSFLFMKYAPTLPSNYFVNRKSVLPPQRAEHQNRYTLVLDLDETLVHCSVNEVAESDLVFPVVFGGDTYQVYMKKRPFFQQFLESVSEIFEVVVFTASQQCYADALLDLVDPQKKLIHHRLFRHHCINVEGNYVKDLRVLGRDLSRTMIIDNSPPAFTYQVDNGIPIVSWYDDKHDTELLKMIPLLKKLTTLTDIRPTIKKYFMLKKLIKSVKM